MTHDTAKRKKFKRDILLYLLRHCVQIKDNMCVCGGGDQFRAFTIDMVLTYISQSIDDVLFIRFECEFVHVAELKKP